MLKKHSKKSRSRGRFSKFCLDQQLFAFTEFFKKTRLSNLFYTANVTKLTKVILESTYRVLQVKSKTLKQPVYFLRAVEFWPTFDIQIDITLVIFWEKLQNHAFQKVHGSLPKHTNIHINRASHPCEYRLFKKMKRLCIFGGSFFKIEIADILNGQISVQRYIIFEKLRYRGQLLLKYGPPKLLLYFIEYPLDQLYNKHTKIAVNSGMQFSERRYQKKCLLKV